MMPKPKAAEGLNCPLYRKPMCEVCQSCAWWTYAKFKHPQEHERIVEEWNCAIALTPIMTIKAAQESHAASVEMSKLRSSVEKAHDEQITMSAIAVQRASDAVRNAVMDMLPDHSPRPQTLIGAK